MTSPYNRVVIPYDEIELTTSQSIDYQRVNRILEERRKSSKKWLADAVKKAKNKNVGWNECDYLRRRVDELSTLVTKLTIQVNNLSENQYPPIENNLELKPIITKDGFLYKFNKVANVDGLLSSSLIKKGYKKVAVYGVGIVGKIVIDKLQELTDISIGYFMDRKVSEYKGKRVYQEPQDIDVDAVIVTVLNEDADIRRFLKSFYREVDMLMIDDWIDEAYKEMSDEKA